MIKITCEYLESHLLHEWVEPNFIAKVPSWRGSLVSERSRTQLPMDKHPWHPYLVGWRNLRECILVKNFQLEESPTSSEICPPEPSRYIPLSMALNLDNVMSIIFYT